MVFRYAPLGSCRTHLFKARVWASAVVGGESHTEWIAEDGLCIKDEFIGNHLANLESENLRLSSPSKTPLSKHLLDRWLKKYPTMESVGLPLANQSAKS